MESKSPKATLQLWIASVLCLFGLVLLGVAFFTVLVAYGEVMTFAGALFGIDYHYRH